MIRFVNKRIQVVRLAMPYTTVSKRFTIEIVHRVVILVNLLPPKGGPYSVLSLREIITCNKLDVQRSKSGNMYTD